MFQSPLKAKVAAFERQAQESSSPAPIRQTRTKTRQQARQNSQSSENGTSKLPKPTTPSVEIRYPSKDRTPLGQSLLPSKHHHTHNGLRAQPPSASKLAILNNRPASGQPKIRSRENSVEDLARAKEVFTHLFNNTNNS